MATSITDIIAQNTPGNSEGRPVGVPSSYSWYGGWNDGADAPPSGFSSVTGWGQVYQKAGEPAYSSPNARVEVANARTYVHLKTGEWVLVQDQSSNQIAGGHFVTDFSGNAGYAMNTRTLSDGSASFAAPPNGYNDHFWHNTRGTYDPGTVDGVYVQMDMRVNDPNLNLIANLGADWWRTANAPYVDGFSNNPGAGMSNWVELSTEWQTLGFYSMSSGEFQADLPPPLVGSSPTDPQTRPTILSFAPDGGTVGDGITNANVLTLTGTAKGGSTVDVFNGTTKVGSVKANASGNWSFTTGELANTTHAFTAKSTDASGNTSQASSPLNVTVDTVAPTAPSIASFSPDSGTVGDGITNANRLTLTGTTEAGATVRVFNGTSQIGSATANANGSWSLQTARLANGAYSFTASATDAAGNTSTASTALNVRVDSTGGPSEPPPPTGENLLVNGSFEASTVQAGRWAGFSSIPGWTAITGGTIELWNNLNGVKATDGVNFGELDFLSGRDGFYQTVKTQAGQNYDLSFDARTRFPGSTSTIEVLWNNSVVAVVPPGNSWGKYTFSVTGTGGQDRLTFQEAANESADGMGALYDNVSLVAAQTTGGKQRTATSLSTEVTSPPLSDLNESDRAMDLVTQYAASSFTSSAPATNSALSQSDPTSLAPTLTQSQV